MYVELLVENIVYREDDNPSATNQSASVEKKDARLLADFSETAPSDMKEGDFERLVKYFSKNYSNKVEGKDENILYGLARDEFLQVFTNSTLEDLNDYVGSPDQEIEITGKDGKKVKAKGTEILSYIYDANFVGEERVKQTKLYKGFLLTLMKYKIENPEKKTLELTQAASKMLSGKKPLKQIIIWVAVLVASIVLIVIGLIKKNSYSSESTFIEKIKRVYETVTTTAFDIWSALIIIGLIGLAVSLFKLASPIWRKIKEYYQKVSNWLKSKFWKDKKWLKDLVH